MFKISTFRLKLQPSRQSEANFYTEHNGYKGKWNIVVLHPVFDELTFSNCTNRGCFVRKHNLHDAENEMLHPKCNFRNVESKLQQAWYMYFFYPNWTLKFPMLEIEFFLLDKAALPLRKIKTFSRKNERIKFVKSKLFKENFKETAT